MLFVNTDNLGENRFTQQSEVGNKLPANLTDRKMTHYFSLLFVMSN